MKITFFVYDKEDGKVDLSGTVGDYQLDITGTTMNGMHRAYLWKTDNWGQIMWERGLPLPELLEPHITEIEEFINKVASI